MKMKNHRSGTMIIRMPASSPFLVFLFLACTIFFPTTHGFLSMTYTGNNYLAIRASCNSNHQLQQLLPSIETCSSSSSSSTTALLSRSSAVRPLQMTTLGNLQVELTKPLGLILEEKDDGLGGVYIKEISKEGSAYRDSRIAPRDVLVQIGETDVSNSPFDKVMEMLTTADTSKVSITVGDGLGQLNMPKNVVRTLQSTPDAYTVDAVVREAVREIRRSGRMGDLLNVEVVIGAGVQKDNNNNNDTTGSMMCKVRFFAILTTDGVSTYSCNVAATATVDETDHPTQRQVEITALSCAKDEGLGQTFDLISK